MYCPPSQAHVHGTLSAAPLLHSFALALLKASGVFAEERKGYHCWRRNVCPIALCVLASEGFFTKRRNRRQNMNTIHKFLQFWLPLACGTTVSGAGLCFV